MSIDKWNDENAAQSTRDRLVMWRELEVVCCDCLDSWGWDADIKLSNLISGAGIQEDF